jgi:tripartite-type tricarboxylate transporter receptor subunit TctC
VWMMAGVDIRSVPFQGGAPAVMAVIGGRVDVCLADLATAAPGMQSELVRPLAITSRTRSKLYPQLPTAPIGGSGLRG